MIEVWKDIKGYEEKYQISNLGKIKSLRRKIHNHNGFFFSNEKILKSRQSRCGYLYIGLRKNKKRKFYTIHRLIMQSFKEPSSLQVNHIDGNKQNNNLNNLEYCTAKENIRHAWENGLCEKTREKSKKIGKQNILKYNNSKKNSVLQFDKQGNFIAEYESQLEAEKKTGINHYHIGSCCKGKLKTSGNYVWKYKKEN